MKYPLAKYPKAIPDVKTGIHYLGAGSITII